jgi:ATP-dependent DNA helicase RecG
MNYKETVQIELKAELNESVKKEIIAFANTDGGKIYIGIDDDGNVIGLKNAKQDLESIKDNREPVPDMNLLTYRVAGLDDQHISIEYKYRV